MRKWPLPGYAVSGPGQRQRILSRQGTPDATLRHGGSVLSIPEAADSGKFTRCFSAARRRRREGWDQEPLIGRETVKALP